MTRHDVGVQLRDFFTSNYHQGLFRYLNWENGQSNDDFVDSFLLSRKAKNTNKQDLLQQKDMKLFFQKYNVKIESSEVDANKKTLLELTMNLIMKANDQFIRQWA